MVRKIVLAYSGGLDTSAMLGWLKDEYKCEIVTFTANVGQDDDLSQVRNKAIAMGVKDIFIEDLREEFVRDFVFPMLRANTMYEGSYLLGTSIARPLIAKHQIEIAHKTGADAVCHGATGKGNDQIRFELGYYSCDPSIKVIAPWREWQLQTRDDLIQYAKRHGIDIPQDKLGEAPYSIDSNLLHNSFEGKILEDPSIMPDYGSMLIRCVTPEKAPDVPEYIDIEFANGDAVGIDGVHYSPATILSMLNKLGGKHGIGIADIVENRYVGIKSHGVYETPGGTILLNAHRALEGITLERDLAHLKEDLMPRYSRLIYNGYWFSPERLALQALFDSTQKNVSGKVIVKLYKGTALVVSRSSQNSIYSQSLASFDSKESTYDQSDASGFIRIISLPFRKRQLKK